MDGLIKVLLAGDSWGVGRGSDKSISDFINDEDGIRCDNVSKNGCNHKKWDNCIVRSKEGLVEESIYFKQADILINEKLK